MDVVMDLVCFACTPSAFHPLRHYEGAITPIHDFWELGTTALTSHPDTHVKTSRGHSTECRLTELSRQIVPEPEDVRRRFGVRGAVVILQQCESASAT